MKIFEFNKETDVEIISETDTYRGFLKIKQFNLRHRLFKGGWSAVLNREICTRPCVAAALPYDPVLDKVVLIQQFRIGAINATNPWLIEIVAGLADETDDSLLDVIHREMKEECGLTTQQLHKIYDYWVSPGASNEYVSLFCARVDASLAGGIHGLAAEHEDISVQCVSSEEAFAMLGNEQINNALAIMALQWLQLNKEKLIKMWSMDY